MKSIHVTLCFLAVSMVLSVCTIVYLIAINVGGDRDLIFELFNVTLLLVVRGTEEVSLATLNILRLIFERPNERLVIIAANIGALSGLLAGTEMVATLFTSKRPEGSMYRRLGRYVRWSLLTAIWGVAALLFVTVLRRYNIFEFVPVGAYAECLVATAVSFLIVAVLFWAGGILVAHSVAYARKFKQESGAEPFMEGRAKRDRYD
jgi:hypothetical protein